MNGIMTNHIARSLDDRWTKILVEPQYIFTGQRENWKMTENIYEYKVTRMRIAREKLAWKRMTQTICGVYPPLK